MSTVAHDSHHLKHHTKKYNKWYVDPTKQFIEQTENPKGRKELLGDEQYIYKNLRNQNFWEWSHPFERKSQLKQPYSQPLDLEKLDPNILKKFKKHLI